MSNQQLKEYCAAEFENIDAVFAELFNVVQPDKAEYTAAELAAIAVFVHNCYNGIENILKRVLLSRNIRSINTPTWHKDLLKSAFENRFISESLYETLSTYLSFRHFFVHAYSFSLKWDELKPLVESLSDTVSAFKKEIYSAIE